MAQSVRSEIKGASNTQMVLGVLIALLGIFMLSYPFFAASVLAALFGGTLLLVAILQLLFAFNAKDLGNMLWLILGSLLYGAAGVILLVHPTTGAMTLTALLGVFLVCRAIFECVAAFTLRPVRGWTWMLLDSVVTLLLGGMILAAWPSSTVWALGTLLGISVLFSGFSRIMLASSARSTLRIATAE